MAWPKDTWSAQIFSSHSPPFFLISLLRLRNMSTPLSEKCRGKMYGSERVRDLVPHCSTRSTHVVRASLVCEHFIVHPSEGQNARRERKWKTLGTRLWKFLLQLCDISGWFVLTVSRKITVLYISSTPKQNLMFPQWIRSLVSAFILKRWKANEKRYHMKTFTMTSNSIHYHL